MWASQNIKILCTGKQFSHFYGKVARGKVQTYLHVTGQHLVISDRIFTYKKLVYMPQYNIKALMVLPSAQ
jgi:hypothetical protein